MGSAIRQLVVAVFAWVSTRLFGVTGVCHELMLSLNLPQSQEAWSFILHTNMSQLWPGHMHTSQPRRTMSILPITPAF